MRKFFGLFAMMLVVTTLAACGGDDAADTADTGSDTEMTEEE